MFVLLIVVTSVGTTRCQGIIRVVVVVVIICLVRQQLLSESFFMAPSNEARETHRCLKNRLGIFRARDGGFLDHPCVPCRQPSHPLRRSIRKATSRTIGYCLLMNNYALCILFPFHYIACRMWLVSVLMGGVGNCLFLLPSMSCQEAVSCFI